MRALGIIKTNLNIWMQRHHLIVADTSMRILILTMLLDISFYYQGDLIFWHDLMTKPLAPHFLLVSMMACVSFQLGYQLALRYFPEQCLESLIENARRLHFANFIVRRLLHQLELASKWLPKPGTAIDLTDPATQQRFRKGQMAAYRAVQLFRRNANAVLDREPLECRQESRYNVVLEQQEELRRDGCPRLYIIVTDRLLRQLLSPFGEDPRSPE